MVEIWSPTEREVRTLAHFSPMAFFGRSVACTADCDGDGEPELLVGMRVLENRGRLLRHDSRHWARQR